MARSCPSPSKRLSESSWSSWSDFVETMQESMPESEAFAKSSASDDSMASSEAKFQTQSVSDPGDSEAEVAARTRSLIARIDDFRQSYNRTHGQVCEFFERARVVQKLGLLDTAQAAQLAGLSGDEGDDEDCNSIADCNYADGQKTTGMKRKLRKWRKVMRSALLEICPELGLESQPDINPGLMKHILDEVRTLKSQLAVQHSNILQLARNAEKFRVDSEQKEQFIADLLQNCKGIRLDSSGPSGTTDGTAEGDFNFENIAIGDSSIPLPASVDDVQFGRARDIVDSLKLDMEATAGTGDDDLVVEPLDFASAQMQLQILAKQTRGATGETTCKAESSSGATYLGGMDTVRNREPLSFDIQSHMASREFSTTEHPISSTPIHCAPTSGTRNSSNASTDVEPKGRPFLVNLGASLTAAVIGGLLVNSVNTKR